MILKKMVYVVGFSIFLLFGSCRRLGSAEQENKNLLETDKRFAQMSIDQNAATAFDFFLCEEALQLPHGHGPIFGKEQILKAMMPQDSSALLSWIPQDSKVSRSGDLGYTWGVYESQLRDSNNQLLTNKGKYLNIWKRQKNGEWKVLVDMGNSGSESVE